MNLHHLSYLRVEYPGVLEYTVFLSPLCFGFLRFGLSRFGNRLSFVVAAILGLTVAELPWLFALNRTHVFTLERVLSEEEQDELAHSPNILFYPQSPHSELLLRSDSSSTAVIEYLVKRGAINKADWQPDSRARR